MNQQLLTDVLLMGFQGHAAAVARQITAAALARSLQASATTTPSQSLAAVQVPLRAVSSPTYLTHPRHTSHGFGLTAPPPAELAAASRLKCEYAFLTACSITTYSKHQTPQCIANRQIAIAALLLGNEYTGQYANYSTGTAAASAARFAAGLLLGEHLMY